MVAAKNAIKYLESCMRKNDSAGGVIECRINGGPAGIGDPVFGKLDAALAQALMSIGAVKAVEIGDGAVCVFDEKLAGDDLREIVNLLLERGASVCGAFGGTDQDGYRYVIGSKTEDVRLINQKLKEKFDARGGGKPEMVQGSLTGTEMEIKALF